MAQLEHPAHIDSRTAAIMDVTPRPPLVFVRGDGTRIWDDSGRAYLDFVQGWAVNAFGHAPRLVRDALAHQAAALLSPGPGFFNEPSIRLANALVRHSTFDRVFFANSGAEANEGAIKLARRWGARHRSGAHEIVTFAHSFHGRTLATMAASGKPAFRDLFEPKVPGFPKAVLNDLASVERHIGPQTVAVMIEPIQGEAGVWCAEDRFLRDLHQMTRDAGILLIVDEVQTGMGRTGTLWAHQHAGIEPDIMTLGKMLGGGVPLSALLATESAACFEHGDQGGTLNGNPLMTAVGCAVLDGVLAPGVLESVRERGRQLEAGLQALSVRHALGGVRGRGLLWALDLDRVISDEVVREARHAGLLVNAPQPGILRFMPPLNVSAREIGCALAILDAVIAAL